MGAVVYCNGVCCFCSVPCTREIKGNQEKISANSVVKENLTTQNPINEENSEVELLSNSEKLKDEGTYIIKKNIFGKDVVRKVKNENRTLGIEYSAQ